MIEVISNIIQTTLESFDFAYCISVNILTYLIIKLVSEKKKLTKWNKRLVLVLVILILSLIYILYNVDYKTVLNSAILAPVFWSWIMKPICKKFKIDYPKIDSVE